MECDLVGGHAELQRGEGLAIVPRRLADVVRSFPGAGPLGNAAMADVESAQGWIATTGEVTT